MKAQKDELEKLIEKNVKLQELISLGSALSHFGSKVNIDTITINLCTSYFSSVERKKSKDIVIAKDSFKGISEKSLNRILTLHRHLANEITDILEDELGIVNKKIELKLK